MSSAEFEINSNLMNTMFGYPKYFQSGKYLELNTKESNDRQQKQIPLKKEDIDKLGTWDEYKEQIKLFYNEQLTYLDKDINNQWWVICPGTGWGCMYTVSLGDLKV